MGGKKGSGGDKMLPHSCFVGSDSGLDGLIPSPKGQPQVQEKKGGSNLNQPAVAAKGSSHEKKTVKKGDIVPFWRPPPLNGSKGDICCLITDKSA